MSRVLSPMKPASPAREESRVNIIEKTDEEILAAQKMRQQIRQRDLKACELKPETSGFGLFRRHPL